MESWTRDGLAIRREDGRRIFWYGYARQYGCSMKVSEEEKIANAHLATAAPELLESARIDHALFLRGYLLATARQLGPEAEETYLAGGAAGLREWARRKREAAIAKAEGREL
jgi:hypothetical protein